MNTEPATWSIYGLRLPRNPIRYVGSTQSGIQARLEAHRRRARSNPTTKLHVWMIRVGPYRVETVLLETTPAGDVAALDEAEERWIALLGGVSRLLNMTAGGAGRGHDEPVQTARRTKMSGENHWNYGRTVSDETKARISARLRERSAASVSKPTPITTEQRKVISDRAALTNHTRWHASRDIIKSGCAHCPTDTPDDVAA